MVNEPPVRVPNPVQQHDAAVLIGILAIPEGAIWAGSLDEQAARGVADRFVRQGLLAPDYDRRDLRQAINDTNHRLRYAAGEYDSPLPPIPLPP